MSAERLILKLLDTTDPSVHQRQDVELALPQLDVQLYNLLVRWADEIDLKRDLLDARLTVILTHQLLIHVADDVADGDCHYFESGPAQGATTQFTLHNLAGLALVYAADPDLVRVRFHKELAAVAAAQHMEVRMREWDLASAQSAASGLNGKQMGAYLKYFGRGTGAKGRRRLGYCFGVAGHVARDIATGDPRYFSLAEPDRGKLKAWAKQHALTVRDGPSLALREQITPVFRHLH